MRGWVAVVGGAAAVYALKLLGYLVPARWLVGARVQRATALIPVAALAALVAIQTFARGANGLTLDARLVGLGVAAALLAKRANFLVVIVAAAAATALARATGLS